MSPVTVVWTATGAICLTLGFVYLVIWVQQRTSKAHLLFALAAFGAAGNAFCDLATMKAESVRQWVFWAKAAHAPLFVLLASLAWFVVAYFGTTRAS
jgi:lipoprotein signal peptidase